MHAKLPLQTSLMTINKSRQILLDWTGRTSPGFTAACKSHYMLQSAACTAEANRNIIIRLLCVPVAGTLECSTITHIPPDRHGPTYKSMLPMLVHSSVSEFGNYLLSVRSVEWNVKLYLLTHIFRKVTSGQLFCGVVYVTTFLNIMQRRAVSLQQLSILIM